MITFGTDVADLILQRTLYDNTLGLNSSIERMTTGFKVNHAKDNAANYSIITDLNKEISSMLQVQQNAGDGLALLQTAQGGLEEIEELLQRLRALATQASNGNYSVESRDAMQAEADQIIEQIAQIRETMEYNGLNLYSTPADGGTEVTSIGTAAVNRLVKAAKVNNTTYDMYPAGAGANTGITTESPVFTPVSAFHSTNQPAKTTSTETSASTKAGSSIEGAEDFAGNASKTLTIDGVQYTVKNKVATSQSLSYIKDTSTGEITFIGNDFEIHGQSDVSHNILINGSRNYVYGGNLSDTITLVGSNCYSNYIYGGDGDDTFDNMTASNIVYGEAGNDTIYIKGSTTFYGDIGNDTIYIEGSGATAYGSEGDDIFYISGKDHGIYGEGGEDSFYLSSDTTRVNIDGGNGTNYIEDNGIGNVTSNVPGATAFSVDFAAKETKELTINNIKYTVTNSSSLAGTFLYSIDYSTGEITFTSSNFKIYGEENKAHNVYIKSPTSSFYGGNLADTIKVYRADEIHGNGGNDIITISAYTDVYGGDGDDVINITSGERNVIYTGNGNDTINMNGDSGSYINMGNGDDTINLTGVAKNSVIIGGKGTNILNGGTLTNGVTTNFEELSDNTGVIELKASEVKNIVINGIEYTITNRINYDNALAYKYNPVTREITFGGAGVSITGQADKEHNVILYGTGTFFYGGNMNDTIKDYSYASLLYGRDGNDKIYMYGVNTKGYGNNGDDYLVNNGSAIAIEGGAGNDTIVLNKGCSSVKGGAGDDTYTINAGSVISDESGNNIYNINADDTSVTGGTGDDTFYINGNNNIVNGAAGNDYYVITGSNNESVGGTGTNYYIDIGQSNSFVNVFLDPNSRQLIFSYQGEVQNFTIDGKTYTVTNNAAGSNTLNYSFNPNTGIVGILGSQFTIDAEFNQAANLEIRGDNNVINGSSLADNISVEQGSNNVINGLSGNDNLTAESENNSLNGGDGDDTITINASTNLAVTGGAGDDTINVNSDNNTNIDAGEGNNRIVVEGSQNNISADDGNNTITINADSNTVNAGDGANRFVVSSSSNTITAGSGANIIGIQGNNNNLTAQNASGTINIYGNENTLTNTRGENDVVIEGNRNNYTTTLGDKDITVKGDNNELLTGSGDDEFDVRGDGNNIESTAGENEFTIRGDGNTIQGGSDIDDISINGDNNTANGGDSSDAFMISSGNNNTVDGEAGERNTMINNGVNTIYSNVVDITPRPFEVNIKVDIGSGVDKFISTEISFNLFDFSVDFSSQEGALESLEDIDNLLNDVQDQLLNIGTTINRLDSVLEAQILKINNLISTRSTLRDADVAEESSNFIKYRILQEASATLMSTSRNLKTESVLGLLQRLN